MTVDGQASTQNWSGLASIQMPPRGEGVGMVLEDVLVFAQLVGRYGAARWNDIFARYEELRRKGSMLHTTKLTCAGKLPRIPGSSFGQ